jgi:hypothetical protein
MLKLNCKAELEIEEFYHKESFDLHNLSVKSKSGNKAMWDPSWDQKTFDVAITSKKVLLASVATLDLKTTRINGQFGFLFFSNVYPIYFSLDTVGCHL